MSAKELATQLKMPYGVTTHVLEILVKANVLTEMEDKNKNDNLFLPIRTFESITLVDLFFEIDKLDETEIPSMEGVNSEEYFSRYSALQKAIKGQSENLKIKDLPRLL